MKLSCGGDRRDVRVEKDHVRLDETTLELRFSSSEEGKLEIWLDGERHRAAFVRDGGRLLVWLAGRTFSFERAASSARSAEHAGSLAAPMPGRVRRALVREGERVEKGQVVLVLEAMKMEHAIRAPAGGVVVRFFHGEGELVDAGVELVRIDAEAEDPRSSGVESPKSKVQRGSGGP